MKKFLALLMAVIMVFSLCACGQQAATTATEAAPAAEEAAPTAEEAAPAEKITINFPCIWVGTDSKAAYFGKMVEDFNKENEGAIEVVIEEQTDYQAYRDKIRTLCTAGQVPDICTIDVVGDVEMYSESGLFMDLTPYMEAGWGDDFVEGAFDNWIYDGKLSVLPLESAVFPICYNKSILAECGYDEFPDNYEDMMAMFKDIKSKGYNAMGQMAGENAWSSMLWYSSIVQAIGGQEAYENGLSDPAWVQGAEILKEMYDYTFDGAVSAGAGDVNGHFIARDTAVYLNGPWWIANFYKEDNAVDGKLLADDIEVVANPTYEGGKGEGGLITTCQAFVLCAKQEDPAKEAAVIKFLQYITEPTRVAEWSASAGSMFFVKYEPTSDASAISQKFTEISNNAKFTVLHANATFPTAFQNEFPAAVSALVLGQVDAQGFVDQLQAAIDAAE